MTKLIALLLLIAVWSPTLGQTEIERAVLAANDRITEAAQSLDAGKMFSFIAGNDKGSIIQAGRIFLTPEEAQASVKNGFAGLRKIEYRWKRRLVTVVSPTTAILVAEGESTATTQQGDTFVTPFVQTVIYVERNGEWKILHAHQSTAQ